MGSATYEFGTFRLDAEKRLLWKAGEHCPIAPKSFDTLLYLLQNSGRTIAKDELMAAIWPDTVVEENNLNKSISALRQLFGEKPGEHRFIVTIPGQGYRFVATVIERMRDENRDSVHFPVDGRPYLVAPRAGNTGTGWAGTNISAVPAEPGLEEIAFAEPHVQTMRPSSGSSVLTTTAKKRRLGTAATITLVVLLTLTVGYGIFALSTRNRLPFQKISFKKLTDTGDIGIAGISPDGNYLVYSVKRGGKQSLRLRHLSSNSDTQIVTPAATDYLALSFSPDSNFYYFNRLDAASVYGTVYRVPVLGGDPQLVVRDVDSNICFSPDGSQLIFRRDGGPQGDSGLFVSDPEGRNVTEWLKVRRPEFFWGDPQWSRDGKRIYIRTTSGFSFNERLNAFDVGDKKRTDLGPTDDGYNLISIPSSDAFAATVRNRESSWLWAIGMVPAKGGVTTLVTHDPSYYAWGTLTVTRDGKHLLTAKQSFIGSLEVYSLYGGKLGSPTIVSEPSEENRWVSWANNDSFFTTLIGFKKTWRKADGTDRKIIDVADRVTAGPYPCGSRYLVSLSQWGVDASIYRRDLDGRNEIQLTRGIEAWMPRCTADGKWVYFSALNADKRVTMHRISTDGGIPQDLGAPTAARHIALSSNSRLALSIVADGSTVADYRAYLALYDAETGKLLDSLDAGVPEYLSYAFTADGKAAIFSQMKDDVYNLYVWKFGDKKARRLTDFREKTIFDFDISPDGSRVLMARGDRRWDAVMITDESK